MHKIIHVDMDAFFAAVEQRNHPELRGKPVVVGGRPRSRGVVCTASYEARKYGIHSAMPSFKAYELCPHAVFLEPDMEAYRRESEAVFEIFHRYSNLVEGVSIDEAYIDVTENYQHSPSATYLAMDIRESIRRERNLTASAGVSYNKFLAKMASERRKPDGLSVITPANAAAFLAALPIEKFHGIGRVTAKKFLNMGIKSGADLLKLSPQLLHDNFGKAGDFYYNIVRGIDLREVEIDYERKSFGREITLSADEGDLNKVRYIIGNLAEKVAGLLQEHAVSGRTVNLKAKFADFTTVTRAFTADYPMDATPQITPIALNLLEKLPVEHPPFRLLGVSVSNLSTQAVQLPPIQLEFNFNPPEPDF